MRTRSILQRWREKAVTRKVIGLLRREAGIEGAESESRSSAVDGTVAYQSGISLRRLQAFFAGNALPKPIRDAVFLWRQRRSWQKLDARLLY